MAFPAAQSPHSDLVLLAPSQIIIEKELEALFRARVSEHATKRSSQWLQVFRRLDWRTSYMGTEAQQTAAETRLLEIMTPRWLHVLVPVKPDMSKEADTTELKKLSELWSQLGRDERGL